MDFSKIGLSVSVILSWVTGFIAYWIVIMLGMRLINLTPKNFQTKKLYDKEVRQLHQGIIQPYAAESQGRILKYYDCFVKKTIMVNTVVFFYDWPLAASGILVGLVDW